MVSVHEEAVRRWARPEARPLGERFPVLHGVADQPVEIVGRVSGEGLPARVRTMLSKGRVGTCGDLAETSVEELGDLRQVGTAAVNELLELLEIFQTRLEWEVSRSDTTTGDTSDPAVAELFAELRARANPLTPVQQELGILLRWAAFSGHENTVGGAVDAVTVQDDLPDDVRAAWSVLRRFELPVEQETAADVLARWLGSLEPRERDIVAHRIIWGDRTLDEIGQDHGVTRERIRQLERDLRRSLEVLLAEDEWRPVRWAAHRLASSVGAWARLADVAALDPWQETDRLVVSLAGLEVDDDEEVVHGPGFRLPGMDDLPYLPPEGEVLDHQAARTSLTESGVLDLHVDHALRAVGLKQIEGTWVRWSRSYVDQSVAILAVVGEPMAVEELTERTGSASVRSMRQRLYEDGRVQRVTRSEVGLRSWGLPEYTSVAELMLKVVADRGGSVPVAELVAHLEQVYEVRPGTVHAYTAAPAFVVQEGTIRARDRSEPYEVDADPAGVAGLRVLDEEKFSYDVHVDHEVLRGSGRPAPEALAGLLGLQPGRSLHFSARDADRTTTGSVVVGWSRTSHMGPYFGSIRAQALHDGAEDGDVLRLTFDPVSMVVRHERVGSNGR